MRRVSRVIRTGRIWLDVLEGNRQRRRSRTRAEVLHIESTTGSQIRQHVLLCQPVFSQRAVLDQILFVQINLPPQLMAAVADVTNLDHVVPLDFTLNTSGP